MLHLLACCEGRPRPARSPSSRSGPAPARAIPWRRAMTGLSAAGIERGSSGSGVRRSMALTITRHCLRSHPRIHGFRFMEAGHGPTGQGPLAQLEHARIGKIERWRTIQSGVRDTIALQPRNRAPGAYWPTRGPGSSRCRHELSPSPAADLYRCRRRVDRRDESARGSLPARLQLGRASLFSAAAERGVDRQVERQSNFRPDPTPRRSCGCWHHDPVVYVKAQLEAAAVKFTTKMWSRT